MKNNEYINQTTLPKKRRGTLNELLSDSSFLRIIVCGILAYLFVVLLFTSLEIWLQSPTNFIDNKNQSNGFFDLLYFNFATILTIGYGDYSPNGLFRTFSIFEAFAGVSIFGMFISILTIKILLPKKNTIIFSKYGYYSLDDQKFMIIYLNISKEYITNFETCYYVKTGNDWEVGPATRAPFLTNAVQTFFLAKIDLKFVVENYGRRDCLRVGLSGSLGMANYSTSIEYLFNQILIIQNRDNLTEYEGFREVDEYLKKNRVSFNSYFHYRPNGSETLLDYITTTRTSQTKD